MDEMYVNAFGVKHTIERVAKDALDLAKNGGYTQYISLSNITVQEDDNRSETIPRFDFSASMPSNNEPVICQIDKTQTLNEAVKSIKDGLNKIGL